MKKKIMALILCLLFLGSLFQGRVVQADDSVELTDEQKERIENGIMKYEHFLYKVENGEIIIMGYDDKEQKIIDIPEEIDGRLVRTIGKEAFKGSNNEVINIPNTIEFIDEGAFSECKNLKEFNIPSSVKSLGKLCFSKCDSLKELYIPDNVTEIGTDIISNCANLEKIRLSANINTYYALGEAPSLTKVIIPEGPQYFYGTFQGDIKLDEVIFPKSTIKIGDYLFGTFSTMKTMIILGKYTSVNWNKFYTRECPFNVIIYADKDSRIGERAEEDKEYYFYYENKPITIENVSTDLESPQIAGKSINIDTLAYSGNVLQYKYSIYKDGKEVEKRDSSYESAFNWTPKEAGKYEIKSIVTDNKGNELEKSIEYTIKEKKLIVDELTVDKDKELIKGDTVNLSTHVINGSGSEKYKFSYVNKDTKKEGIISDYSSNNSLSWTINEAGNYILKVEVADNGTVASKEINITVKPITITGVDNSFVDTLLIGDSTTFLINAKGGSGKIRYSLSVDGEYILNNSYDNSIKWTATEKKIYKIVATAVDENDEKVTFSREIVVDDKLEENKYVYIYSNDDDLYFDSEIWHMPSTKDYYIKAKDNYTIKYSERFKEYKYELCYKGDEGVKDKYKLKLVVKDGIGFSMKEEEYELKPGIYCYKGGKMTEIDLPKRKLTLANLYVEESDNDNYILKGESLKIRALAINSGSFINYSYYYTNTDTGESGAIIENTKETIVDWVPNKGGNYTIRVVAKNEDESVEKSVDINVNSDEEISLTELLSSTGDLWDWDCKPVFTIKAKGKVSRYLLSVNGKCVLDSKSNNSVQVEKQPENTDKAEVVATIFDEKGNKDTVTKTMNVNEKELFLNFYCKGDCEGYTVQRSRMKSNFDWEPYESYKLEPSYDLGYLSYKVCISEKYVEGHPGTERYRILDGNGKVINEYETDSPRFIVYDKENNIFSANCVGDDANGIPSNINIMNYNSSLGEDFDYGKSTELSAFAIDTIGEVKYKYSYKNVTTGDSGIIQPYSTNNKVDWIPDKPGVYNVTLEVKDNIKFNSKVIRIKVYGNDTDKSLLIDSIDSSAGFNIEESDITTLTINDKYGVGKKKYSLQIDDKNILTNSSFNSVKWKPLSENTYRIKATVIDENNVIATKVTYIRINRNEEKHIATVYYNSDKPMYACYKIDGYDWIAYPGVKMEKSDDIYGYNQKIEIDLKDSYAAHIKFHDGNGNWDDNGGENYYIYRENSGIRDGKKYNSFNIEQERNLNIDKFISSKTNIVEGESVELSALTLYPTGDVNYVYLYKNNSTGESGEIGRGLDDFITWTPTKVGDYTITVNATDDNFTRSKSINLKVGKQSKLEISSISSSEGSKIALGNSTTLSINAINGNGDNKYTLSVNGKELLSNSSNNSVKWTPSKVGSYTIKATVVDKNNVSATSTITLNVEEITSNKTVIYYNGYNPAYIHYKVNNGNWTSAPGVKMENCSDVEGYNQKIEIDLGEESGLTACFNNGSGKWDSNGGKNYSFGTGYYTFSNGKITAIDKPVKELTIKNFTANPSKITEGEKVNLSTSIINNTGDVQYIYSYKNNTTGESGVIESSSNNSISWTPKTAGDYTLTVQATDDKITTNKSISFTVEKFKDVEISSINSSAGSKIALGNSTTLSINAINGHGDNKYTLSVNGEELLSNSSNNSVKWTPSEVGSYTVKATVVDKNNISATSTITLNVEEITSNKTVIYYNGYNPAYIHYRVNNGNWTSAPGVKMESCSDVEGYNQKIEIDLGEENGLTACFNNGSGKWDSNGGKNYSFGTGYYTFSNGKITAIDKPVKELTIKSFTANPSKITEGEKVNLTTSIINNTGDVEYIYSYKNNTTGESGVIESSSNNSISWTPETAGDYTLTVQATDDKITTNKSISFTVEKFKDVEISSINSSAGSKIALGNSTTLSINAINGHGDNKYTLSVNGKELLSNSSNNSVEWTPSEVGSYTIKATVVDKNNVSATLTITLNVEEITSNKTVIYYNGYNPAYIHYKVNNGNWTSAPGVKMENCSDVEGYNQKIEIDLGEESGLIACFNNGSGNWDSNGGRNYSFGTGYYTFSNGKITAIDKPVKELTIKSFTANPSKITEGEKVSLSTSIINNTGDVQYIYSYKNNTTGESGVIESSSNNSISWTPKTAGDYTLTVQVTDEEITKVKSINFTVNEFKNVEENKMIIYYKGYSNAYIHYKIGNGSWTLAPGVKMNEASDIEGYSKITIDLGEEESITACFNNGSGSWDNNNSKNYTITGAGTYTISNKTVTKVK